MIYPAKVNFLGEDFQTPRGVLLPHVATEYLVLAAMAQLDKEEQPLRLGLEVGVGAGVISISLLRRFSGLVMVASDVSRLALAISQQNADAVLGQESVRLELVSARHIDEVYEAFGGVQLRGDFLISNPPYLLPNDDISEFYRNNMPDSALYAPDPDGLLLYHKLAAAADELLRPGGWVFLEARAQRAAKVEVVFANRSFRTEVFDKHSLCGAYSILHPDPTARDRQLLNHRFVIARKTA
jgi:release factor glutamine methyltransferase